MTMPEIARPEQWRAARIERLAKEKELTKARDALSSARRELPMVRVSKDYRFDGPAGGVTPLDLFEGRRQLIIQHFMFDPSWEDGCPSCTAASDEISPGLQEHLAARATTLAVVSRAPLAKLGRPWPSGAGTSRGTRRTRATSPAARSPTSPSSDSR